MWESVICDMLCATMGINSNFAGTALSDGHDENPTKKCEGRTLHPGSQVCPGGAYPHANLPPCKPHAFACFQTAVTFCIMISPWKLQVITHALDVLYTVHFTRIPGIPQPDSQSEVQHDNIPRLARRCTKTNHIPTVETLGTIVEGHNCCTSYCNQVGPTFHPV